MFFARKFSTKKTPELLDLIDSYMIFNTSTEAGLYWPGFYQVDTSTPGKQWVQNHQKKKRDLRKEMMSKMGKLLGIAGLSSPEDKSSEKEEGINNEDIVMSLPGGGEGGDGGGGGGGQKRKGGKKRKVMLNPGLGGTEASVN